MYFTLTTYYTTTLSDGRSNPLNDHTRHRFKREFYQKEVNSSHLLHPMIYHRYDIEHCSRIAPEALPERSWLLRDQLHPIQGALGR